MLSAVIVDDEELEREGLKNNIDWASLNINLIGTYDNGVTAYESIVRAVPDILLTDIKMPFMDGITLAEKVRKLSPQTKVIFISGYEDFSYAKKAIDVSAVKYILKPFEIEDFISTIKQTAQLCVDEKKTSREHENLKIKLKESLPLLKEKFFRDLLHGMYQSTELQKISNKLDMFDIPLLAEGSYFVNLLTVDNFDILTSSKGENYQYAHFLEIHEFINGIVMKQGFCVSINEFTFAIIQRFDMNGDGLKKNYQFIEHLTQNLSKKYSACTTVGIGKCCQCINNVHIAYKQAHEALIHRFALDNNEIIYFEDINVQDTVQLDIALEQIKLNILKLVEQGNTDEIEKQIGTKFELMAHNKMNKLYIQNVCIDLINSLSKSLLANGIDIDVLFGQGTSVIGKLLRYDSIHDIHMWERNIIVMVCKHLEQQNITRNGRIVEQIKSIVERRFSDDITVAEIASEVSLSAGYATMVFKKETGESIMRYLIKTRINTAKSLLANPNTRISEVSYEIGYSNLAYFTALFRSEVGVTPKEYRDKHNK